MLNYQISKFFRRTSDYPLTERPKLALLSLSYSYVTNFQSLVKTGNHGLPSKKPVKLPTKEAKKDEEAAAKKPTKLNEHDKLAKVAERACQTNKKYAYVNVRWFYMSQ